MKAWRTTQPMRHALALILLVVFIGFLWSARHDVLRAVRNLSVGQTATIAGLLLAQWGLRAWRDRLLFASAGYPLGVVSLFWLNNVQLALNYLPLRAGTLSSASLLLARFGIPLDRFAGIVSQQVLLNTLVSTSLAAGAVWYSAAGTGIRTRLVFLLLLGIAIFASVLLFWHRRVLTFMRLTPNDAGEEREPRRQRMERIWQGVTLVGLTVLVSLVSATRVSVVFGVVAARLGMADAIVVSASLMLSPLLAVTPAGIGVTESLVGLAAELVDQAGRLGVIAATLDRVLVLAVSALSAALLTPIAWPRVRSR